MADLEQELRDKINNARKEQAEEEANKEEPSTEPIEDEPQDEPQDEPEDEPSTPKTEPEGLEEEVEEDFEEIDTKSEEFKKLTPEAKKDAKKFYHMRQENIAKDKRIQEMAERLARVEGAQQVIQQQPLEEKTEEIPDRDVDPDAYYDYQLKQKDQKIEALEKKFDNFEARTVTTEAEQLYKELENQHTEKDSSYKDAKSFLLKTLRDEIKQENPAATESQISQHLKQQEYSLVATLAKSGWSQSAIFNSIKAQAIDKGYVETKEIPKLDKTKLKRNMEKSANLNEIPNASGELGINAKQLVKMNIVDVAKLTNDPEALKKAKMAIKRARIKAMS